MKTNESTLDRILRVIAGAALLSLFFFQVVGGTLGIALLILGGVLMITGLIGFCPLYTLVKITTRK
jgi:hypothetical protein